MKQFSTGALVALLAIGALSLSALAADPPSSPSPPPSPPKQEAPKAPSYDNDIQPFFDATCVVCHLSGGQNGGLVLENGESYKYLVNAKAVGAKMKRVAPGNIDKSYLLHKIKGTHAKVGGTGERMPLGGAPTSPEAIAMIEAWIKAGAKEK